MLAIVAETTDPAINSAPPDGLFFALSADEAGTDIEFFTNEAWVLNIRRTNITGRIAPASNTFIVLEVFDAGKRVLLVVVKL